MTTSTRQGSRYAYTMHITETVESQCVIESDKKLTFEQLAERAEKKRVDGKLTFTEVSNTEIWCEAASKDGQPDDNAIA